MGDVVYDFVGDTLVKWQQGGWPRTMAYDAANRLVTELYGAARTTTVYDRAGNPVLKTESGGGQTGFVYDGENRLLKETHPGGTISSYTYQSYDGLRRTRQEPGQPVSTTVWDGSNYLGEI